MADSCSCDTCSCNATPTAVSQEKVDHPWRVLWQEERAKLLNAGVALLLFILALLFGKALGENLRNVYGGILLLSGWRVFTGAFKGISRGNGLDERFLMSIAAIGAFLIGEYPEAIAVMLFYEIGELFQAQAVSTSKNAIAALIDLRPKMVHFLADDDDAAEVIEEGSFALAPAEKPATSVCKGSLILVRPGEQIPLDGVIVKGESTLNTAFITGESVPRAVAVGVHVDAGCINGARPLVLQTTSTFENSAIARILALLKDSAARKSHHEMLIRRFAKIYTPIVVVAAAFVGLVIPSLLALPFINVGTYTLGFYQGWIYRALVFLVVSCPCALVITVPLTYFASLGAFAKQGVLIKGETFVEQIAEAKTILFDKTGTLTRGKFEVIDAHVVDSSLEQTTSFALLEALESHSNHPLAQSIVAYASQHTTDERATVENIDEVAGHGMSGTVRGSQIKAGNASFMTGLNESSLKEVARLEKEAQGTIIFFARDDELLLALELSDTLKPNVRSALAELKREGITTVMLTGDEETPASLIARQSGISAYRCCLLPEDKVEVVANYTSSAHGRTLFCGDGINDAPSLARADVGIAMGGLGSDAAIQAADVVLTHDDISTLPLLIAIARKTIVIAKQNIMFALGIKALILLLALLGFASMWAAVFADVGVTILLIFNALRMLRVKG